jgi:hemerythrin-like domain-containing protein
MKRCPALQDLSREHHTALRLALHLKRVASGGDEAAVDAACAETRAIFASELLPHFREEEQCLLPRLQAAGASAVVARTLIEHRALQRLVRDLEIPDRETLLRFAELMTTHVRFEERELFDQAEALLGAETLARLMRRQPAEA